MALTVDGIGYVLSGPVTLDELDRIAQIITTTKPGTV
jgi:hypothetical protein